MEFVESIFLASFSRKQGQLLCAGGKKQQTADWRNKVCIIICSSAVVDNLHNLRSLCLICMWQILNFLFFTNDNLIELVSKELNHFGVIADLFRQIGAHSSRFVLLCSFWRLFTIKMIKSVKVFPFWKIITFFFLLHKIQTPGINMQNGHQVI